MTARSLCRLTAAAYSLLLLAAGAVEEGTDLFGSGDFSQWTDSSGKLVSDGWSIADGVLHRSGKTPEDIVTRKHYENFELTFEWKIAKGGNSGVKYRTRGSLGLEFQILDDGGGGNPLHRAGGLYELVAPDGRLLNPPGEWNASRIVAKRAHIEHWLNGKKVVSIDQDGEDWKERFNRSKYKDSKGFGGWKGPILIQGYLAFPAWFRNVRVREL